MEGSGVSETETKEFKDLKFAIDSFNNCNTCWSFRITYGNLLDKAKKKETSVSVGTVNSLATVRGMALGCEKIKKCE